MTLINKALALAAVVVAGCAMAPSVSLDAARSELAPTGKLRLAVTGNNPNYLNLPSQPPYSGVAVDIGNALAKELGVPLEIVVYASNPEVFANAGKQWDVVLTGIEASRRAFLDYSVPYATAPNAYLVPAGSALMTVSDVDRKGVRVAASRGTIQHLDLQKALRQASLVTVENVATAGVRELGEGRADVLAANRSTLETLAAKMPGYRVLPGSFSQFEYGVAVPKGRSAAAAYVNRVVQQMRASGALAESIRRANVKNLDVPAY